MGVNSNDNYSIYEVADIYPMHYSMLTLDNKQPGAIRKEFMNLIEKEWQVRFEEHVDRNSCCAHWIYNGINRR